MPGCVLRASGVGFEVDKFVESSSLSPCEVYRKGEPKGRGGVHKESGLNIVVSEAGGDDLKQQVEDALKFLEKNKTDVARLLSHVEGASLDFGVWQRNEFGQYFRFPPELLSVAGGLGLTIELSVYGSENY